MYGFSKELMQSGDPRAFLAMSPPASPALQLFEKLRSFDNLIQVKETEPGRPTSLTYNQVALEARNRLRHTLQSIAPGFTLADGYRNLSGMYRGAACVLVGSAGGMQETVVAEMEEMGIVPIALGHASRLLKKAPIWIGYQEPMGYLPTPFEHPQTMAFVQNNYYGQPLWDFGTNRHMSQTPSAYPNSWGFPVFNVDVPAFLDKPERLSNFGSPCTLTSAISLAVVLGFSDILLYGVRLDTELVPDYYAFKDAPHATTIQRKAAVYTKLKQDLPEIARQLTTHCIRLASVDNPNLGIPHYESTRYLRMLFANSLQLARRLHHPSMQRSITTPAQAKRAYLQAVDKYRTKIVSPVHIIDRVAQFKEVAPDLFDTPEINTAIAAVTSEKGCTGCAKNKHARPCYAAFEKAVLDKDGRIFAAWAKFLPEQYILKPNALQGTTTERLIFHPDHAAEQAEYDKAMI